MAGWKCLRLNQFKSKKTAIRRFFIKLILETFELM